MTLKTKLAFQPWPSAKMYPCPPPGSSLTTRSHEMLVNQIVLDRDFSAKPKNDWNLDSGRGSVILSPGNSANLTLSAHLVWPLPDRNPATPEYHLPASRPLSDCSIDRATAPPGPTPHRAPLSGPSPPALREPVGPTAAIIDVGFKHHMA